MSGAMKVCPRCGEEYVLTASTCVDCGVALGFDAPAAGRPVERELPPASELVALRHAETIWIDGLAAALAEAGIPSRVEMQTDADQRRVQGAGMGAIRCTLYVRPSDAAAAARIDADYARTQVPDLPDTEIAWEESEACPGCGTPLASDADECSECGLSFRAGSE